MSIKNLASTAVDINKMDDDELLKFMDECESDWYGTYRDANEMGGRMREFLYAGGGQWDTETKEDHSRRFKRTFENNAVRAIQTQLETELRDSAPEAVLIAATDDIPTDIVETKIGIYREDCYQSNTPDVYTQAFVNQMDIGYGAFRLAAEQEHPRTFNCVLRYKRIADAMNAFFDPSADDLCKINGDYAGYRQEVSVRKLQRLHKDYDFTKDVSLGGKTVTVTHFYLKVYQPLTWVRLDNGHEMTLSEYNKRKKKLDKINERRYKEFKTAVKKMREKGIEEKLIPKFIAVSMPTIVKRQKSTDNYKIMYFMRTRSFILDKQTLPIRRLPVHFVPGNVKIVNGSDKPLPFSIDAMTPQQLLNSIISQLMDNIARSLGVRVMAPSPAIKAHMKDWARPTENNVLMYDDVNGDWNIAKPTIINAPSVDPSLLAIYQQCQNDIRMTLGRSAESMGEQSNTQTFGGIMLRRMASDAAAGIITLNLMASIAEGAKTYLEWMPYVYDTERKVKIRNDNNEHGYKVINQVTGKLDIYQDYIIENDMRHGEFSVEAHGGPSFAMQRLASIHLLMDLMARDPELKSISYDLLFKELPFAYGTKLAIRAKEVGLVNPAIVAKEKGEQEPQPQPSPAEILAHRELDVKEADIAVDAAKVKQKREEVLIEGIENIVKLQADTVTALGTEAKAYGTAPFDPIEEAITKTEGMLKTQGSFLQSAEKDLFNVDNSHKE